MSPEVPDAPDGTDPNQPQQPGALSRFGSAMLQGVAGQSSIGNAVYNAFKPPTPPTAGPYARYTPNSTSAPGNYMNAAGMGAPAPLPNTVAAPPAPAVNDSTGGGGGGGGWGSSAPKSTLPGKAMAAMKPTDLADPGAGAAASGADGGADAAAGMGEASAGAAAPDLAEAALFGGGGIVTKPTLARIGERGPEAVVPLTPRPGNKMQPDVLEGRIAAPRVPGVHYARYKSFNRLGPGMGGQL